MLTRREILSVLGAVPAASLLTPGRLYAQAATQFPQRLLGRTGRQVVPLALGGQASLQWTKPGIDAPDIIIRAIQLGVNYLDSANAYGPSQANYGEAFRRMNLQPAGRAKLYIASKTAQRYAKNPAGRGSTAIDELKRSLTQMFGDGKGFIPEGAYLDAIQIHNLTAMAQVDQIYENSGERVGAYHALVDYRDGTNYTGLNPEHKQWVRHIGLTGHQSSPVLMSAIRRDKDNNFDTVLVALNANDRNFSSHQNNVLPLAVARGLGVIAMKVFADGAIYGKQPGFSNKPDDVSLEVGKDGGIPCSDLVRYPLSLPGVSCAIIGTGKINREKPEADQLVANLTAALKDMPSAEERQRIQNDLAARHGLATNYFQDKQPGIVQPTDVKVKRDGERVVVEWNTALAGPNPLRSYDIFAGDKLLQSIPFRPQLTEAPLRANLNGTDVGDAPVKVIAT
jgi:aryl-alcohol dehydrogenase-like predicted oxidoreductase